jgi:hypothetical protein
LIQVRHAVSLTFLIAVLILGAPNAAEAVIVPQQGMAGVRLGMTEAQVRGVLGRPTSIAHPRNEILGRFTLLRYGAIGISLFSGSGGRVFAIATTGRSQRTTRGVGVGFPEASVRRLVPGVRCRTEFGRRHCYVGAFLPGRIVTDFFTPGGYVSRVVIGRVID